MRDLDSRVICARACLADTSLEIVRELSTPLLNIINPLHFQQLKTIFRFGTSQQIFELVILWRITSLDLKYDKKYFLSKLIPLRFATPRSN